MNTLAILNAINASLTLAETLLPAVTEAVKRGEVTVEQQQELQDKLNSLRTSANQEFQGDQWKIQ